ncbi:MAG: PAS domain S-box protein [Pseudomonadales bacterium]|nr:PAS domain S-box protein [Pseudomonadales bacterium]
MVDQSQNFFALAIGFVSLLDLMVVVGLWLSYTTAGREYLKVACFAGLFEILRHGIDFITGTSNDSITWYLLGQVFQFGSTLLFVAALLLIYETVTRFYYWAFAVLGIGMIVIFVLQMLSDAPVAGGSGYLESSPLIALSFVLLWRAIKTGDQLTPGKLFLVLASASVALIRSTLPALELNDIYLLLYYMEYLSFTLLLVAMVLYELEFAKQQIGDLLAEKTQSEQDLQFIVDNSLDVILVADQVGLLQSWSAKAREIFGYSHEQAVGKIHMDDLFVSNFWGQDMGEDDEVQAKMESIDGKSFLVDVRMREVSEAGGTYHLFVLRLVEEPKINTTLSET